MNGIGVAGGTVKFDQSLFNRTVQNTMTWHTSGANHCMDANISDTVLSAPRVIRTRTEKGFREMTPVRQVQNPVHEALV